MRTIHGCLLALLILGCRGPDPSRVLELAVPGELDALLASPDGERLLCWEGERAWLVDAAEGRPLLALHTGEGPRDDAWRGARFAADGRRAVLFSLFGDVVLIDVPRAEVLWRNSKAPQAYFWRGAADSRLRVLALHREQLDDSSLVLLDLRDRPRELGTFAARSRGGFALAEDGKHVLFENPQGIAKLEIYASGEVREETIAGGDWTGLALVPAVNAGLLAKEDELRKVNLATGATLVSRALADGPWRLAATDPAGRAVLLVGPDSELRAYDPQDLRLLWSQSPASMPRIDAYSCTVWTRRAGIEVTVRDLRSGEALWTVARGVRDLSHAAPATTSAGEVWVPAEDGRLLLLDGRTGSVLSERPAWRVEGQQVGMLGDGTAWFVGRDAKVRTIDSRSGELLAVHALPTRATGALARGTRLVVGTEDGAACVFEGPRLEVRGTFRAGAEILLAADGSRLLAFGGELDGLTVFSLPQGVPLEELGKELGPLRAAAWSDSGQVVAALDGLGQARLWQAGRRVELAESAPRSSLAIDPQGRWLALGDEEPRVLVLDARSGERVAELHLGSYFPFGVETERLRFDARGEYLIASTALRDTLQAWGCSDWERIWVHDFDSGGGAPLEMVIEARCERVWMWGMTQQTPAALELATGRVLLDLAWSGLTHFDPAPGDGPIAALEAGGLVLLDPEGRILLRRVELGELGGVVSRAGGRIEGSAAALRLVSMEVDGRLAPALQSPSSCFRSFFGASAR